MELTPASAVRDFTANVWSSKIGNPALLPTKHSGRGPAIFDMSIISIKKCRTRPSSPAVHRNRIRTRNHAEMNLKSNSDKSKGLAKGFEISNRDIGRIPLIEVAC